MSASRGPSFLLSAQEVNFEVHPRLVGLSGFEENPTSPGFAEHTLFMGRGLIHMVPCRAKESAYSRAIFDITCTLVSKVLRAKDVQCWFPKPLYHKYDNHVRTMHAAL